MLNEYFCSITDLQDEDIPLPDFDDRGPNTLTGINVVEQDIIDIISLLDPNKAVDADRIRNKMLREVKYEIAGPLCLLFNKSLRDEIFPADWKLAHIIPIFKSGDKSSMSNYRPVALLSTISNVFEKVIYKYIFNFLMENALIYKFHSGLIPGHSTTHQLIELINEIVMALDNRERIDSDSDSIFY